MSSGDDSIAFTLRRLPVSNSLRYLAYLLTGKELLVDADHGFVVAQGCDDDVGAKMISPFSLTLVQGDDAGLSSPDMSHSAESQMDTLADWTHLWPISFKSRTTLYPSLSSCFSA